MTVRQRSIAIALPLVLGAVGPAACVNAGSTPETPGPSAPVHNEVNNPLYVEPASYDFAANPKLLERIMASPHGYFRFVNRAFATETCRRLAATVGQVPDVNLHGDAHIEQYAVTDLGRGLTDFDDSTSGPAAIDLLRFSVSLRLTCDARGWQDQADAIIERFLQGYRSALKDPKVKSSEPAVAERIRSGFKYDRKKYFEWIESIVQPVAPEEQAELKEALEPYVAMMCAEDKTLEPRYFEVQSIGGLQMGIGSALDIKFLVRVRGPSDAPEDDVVLEVKEVRNLRGISCISHQDKIDPFRILIGQSRIAYEPYKLLGYLKHHGRVFWIHSWVDNYREVKIGKTFDTAKELSDVVYDVGVQLGRGHPAKIAAPHGLQLRMAQVQMLDEHVDDILRASRKMAFDTVSAWQRFKAEIAHQR